MDHNEWKLGSKTDENPILGLLSNKTYMSAEFIKIRSQAYQVIKCMQAPESQFTGEVFLT